MKCVFSVAMFFRSPAIFFFLLYLLPTSGCHPALPSKIKRLLVRACSLHFEVIVPFALACAFGISHPPKPLGLRHGDVIVVAYQNLPSFTAVRCRVHLGGAIPLLPTDCATYLYSTWPSSLLRLFPAAGMLSDHIAMACRSSGCENHKPEPPSGTTAHRSTA